VQRLPILALAVLALAVAGCGGGGGSKEQAASGGGNTIPIKETEYKLTPGRVNVVSTGSVTFEATNDGQIDHALEVEGNGVEEETETISPGSSAKLTVDLAKPGTYELYCPIDGHRGMGMEATLVVGGAGAGGGTSTDESKTDTGGGYGY
jgi:plastocyanin